ncbi:MAG: pyridoxal phosphate-dependent aminotransferase [Ignavibacteria bacterium]|nr:pyridoxal phosphate-dependent aminotransferase [Ignavibacteria bacterium]
MFSNRTAWDLRPSRLFELLQRKRDRREQIIDLTESNPTRCGFSYNSRGILNALSSEDSLRYEPHPKGLLSAREAVAGFYHRQGVDVDPDHIVLTASTSEAYSHLFRLLCNEREAVFLPKPSYPLFDELCQINDVSCRLYHLAYDGEWHLDLSAVQASFSTDVRAMVLVHPNNPTGSFIKVNEREVVSGLAQAHAAALIVDEVFGTFGFEAEGSRASSFAGNQTVLTFTLNGLSKLLGLPQMKLAWIVVSGPPDERREALQRLEMIGDLYLSVGTPVQEALPALLRDSEPVTQQIRRRVQENYVFLKRELRAESAVSLFHCEGGWNAVLRLPGTRSDEEWALELLGTQDVLVHPGHLFRFEQGSCIVLSLLPPAEVLREGFRRIVSKADLNEPAG